MSTHTTEKLPKAEVKISFEVPWDEAKPYLDEAAKEISTKNPPQGFRPGKATYEDLKRVLGEMKILEAAVERIIRANYVKTVLEEDLETIGSPSISVEQLTPGAALKFTTISNLMPTVKRFPDLLNIKIEKKKTAVEDKNIDDAIEEMRKMQRKEMLVERSVTPDDLIIIDLEMTKGGVAVEGGSSQNYRVYMNEPHYIPGFAEELKDMKAGDERAFTLKFPEDHFQKSLAGYDVEFKAKAKGVYELTLPDADDAFAKTLGLASLLELRSRLRENMEREEQKKSDETAEIEMLEKLTDEAEFSEVPEILLQDEVRRMIMELQRGVEAQGMDWASYLSSVKKTSEELQLDFLPQAMRRIKTAVAIAGFAKKENIQPSEEEVDKEIDHILEHLPEDDKATRERVSSPDYREYVMIQMRNRKVLDWLKEQCIIQKAP